MYQGDSATVAAEHLASSKTPMPDHLPGIAPEETSWSATWWHDDCCHRIHTYSGLGLLSCLHEHLSLSGHKVPSLPWGVPGQNSLTAKRVWEQPVTMGTLWLCHIRHLQKPLLMEH